MGKIKVKHFSLSLDGFGAGVSQDKENPLGIRGMELHQWAFVTKTFRTMIGESGGKEGIDNDVFNNTFENVGAVIMGRNMFGPVRGNWKDEEWKGWWGENPPFHVPVFVLTHHERKSIQMKGGTTFHFITNGIKTALDEAKNVAQGKDIVIGGGVSTIRQFLEAGYIDELEISLASVFLGSGENLFSGIDMNKLGFNNIVRKVGEGATHFTITNQNGK
jgi:dihydrofolate reductase